MSSLKTIRTQAKLSQREMAKRIGLSQPQYCRLERAITLSDLTLKQARVLARICVEHSIRPPSVLSSLMPR